MQLRILENIERDADEMMYSDWFSAVWNQMDMGRRNVSKLESMEHNKFKFNFKDTIPFFIELAYDDLKKEISVLLTYLADSKSPITFNMNVEEEDNFNNDTVRKVINDILDESEVYAFVLRIENIAIKRVELQHDDPRDLPDHGEMIGKEYRIDYYELKRLIPNIKFDAKCKHYMEMGHCWEHFYPKFIKGVESAYPGPIRLKASAFFETMLKKYKQLESSENIGLDQSSEYFQLQQECLTELQVPEAEFDERIQKYMKTYNYSDAQYLQFKRGIDAGKPA